MELECVVPAVRQGTTPFSADAVFCAQSNLLLRELTHRVNNEFASALGVVSALARRSAHPDVKAALADVMDHLESYSRVHRALQMPERTDRADASAYLRQLCVAISQAKLEARNINIVFTDHPLFLTAERCWMLGMIVSEIITNAVRHAFDAAGGEIRVRLAVRDLAAECRISDTGKARGNVRPGRGLKIMQELADALGGQIAFRFGPRGAVVVVRFPLS